VARMVDISRHFIYKWVERFQEQGCAGLREAPRDAWTRRRKEETR
jgi:transposase